MYYLFACVFCVDTIDMNWKFVLYNLVGYDTTLVKSAWYLLVYTEIILTFPLFWRLFTIENDKKYPGLAMSLCAVLLIVFEFIVPVKHLARFMQYMLIGIWGDLQNTVSRIKV